MRRISLDLTLASPEIQRDCGQMDHYKIDRMPWLVNYLLASVYYFRVACIIHFFNHRLKQKHAVSFLWWQEVRMGLSMRLPGRYTRHLPPLLLDQDAPQYGQPGWRHQQLHP